MKQTYSLHTTFVIHVKTATRFGRFYTYDKNGVWTVILLHFFPNLCQYPFAKHFLSIKVTQNFRQRKVSAAVRWQICLFYSE